MASRYTDEQRAQVFMLLEAYDGNVKRVSRETGVPEQTVRDWKKNREREGRLPDTVREALPAVQDEFVQNVRRVRNKALDKLEVAIENDELKGRDLTVAVGVLTDKERAVLQPKPAEGASAGSLPVEQAVELFRGLAAGMIDAATSRRQTISSSIDGEEPIDVEVIEEQVEEEELPALPRFLS